MENRFDNLSARRLLTHSKQQKKDGVDEGRQETFFNFKEVLVDHRLLIH